jgi:hypothetical protein
MGAQFGATDVARGAYTVEVFVPGFETVRRGGVQVSEESGGTVSIQLSVHKPKHLYSWKTLVRSEKNWAPSRALRSNVDIALTLYRNGSWAA